MLLAGENNALANAAMWIEGLLTGQLANIIAVIGIAAVGLLMLQGRVDWKRAVSISVGCFALFGARPIAMGFLDNFPSVTSQVVTEYVAPENGMHNLVPQIDDDPYSGAAYYGAN